jgi:hypothetical protein
MDSVVSVSVFCVLGVVFYLVVEVCNTEDG